MFIESQPLNDSLLSLGVKWHEDKALTPKEQAEGKAHFSDQYLVDDMFAQRDASVAPGTPESSMRGLRRWAQIETSRFNLSPSA